MVGKRTVCNCRYGCVPIKDACEEIAAQRRACTGTWIPQSQTHNDEHDEPRDSDGEEPRQLPDEKARPSADDDNGYNKKRESEDLCAPGTCCPLCQAKPPSCPRGQHFEANKPKRDVAVCSNCDEIEGSFCASVCVAS
jgi:hypothetical protein